MSPSGLNEFLKERWNLDLWPFANLLFIVLEKSFIKSKRNLKLTSFLKYDSIELKSFKDKLLNLKKRITEMTQEINDVFWGDVARRELKLHNLRNEDGKFPYENFEMIFFQEHAISEYFDLIDYYVWNIDRELKNRRPGPLINKRNLLASMWALYLKDENKKVDWDLLAKIIDWFWRILSSYKFYEGLKPQVWIDRNSGDKIEQTFSDYLENQFLKYRQRWDIFYKEYLKYTKFQHLPNKKKAIIFGKKESETKFLISGKVPAYDRDLKKEGKHLKPFMKSPEAILEAFLPEDDFTSFVLKRFYKKGSNFNWIIIFPDFSYLKS